MVRSRSQRVLSTGSYSDSHLPPPAGMVIEDTSSRTTRIMKVATQLLNSLLYLKSSDGKFFLHTAFPENLYMAKCLLERCRNLDELNHGSNNTGRLQERFLLQTNEESGYTPLHSAIVAGDLSAVLLYLQYTTNPSQQQYVTAPIALLQMGQTKVFKATDGEGLTPLELLGTLQIPKLSKCRADLGRHLMPANQLDAGRQRIHRDQRSPSFDLPSDEDEELYRLMQQNRQMLQESMEEKKNDSSSRDDFSYGFEVVTFGRPNHCALGVITGNKKEVTSAQDHHPGTSTFRPQRVQEFAQERVLRDGSAIAVAASTHHTLVVCRNGDLYVFGVNKSGRLGLGDDCPQQCPLPRQIMALRRRRVRAVAAAENHSLCVTSDGTVWSWGNNQFGQLGDTGTSSGNTTTTSRSVPKPVEDLKHIPCSAVAAGEKHSVALSQCGEVYVWGSNSAGQMGVVRRSGNQKVQRIAAFWSSGASQQPCKVALAIAAADQSTLVLIAPVLGSVQVNSVYWFGHGNHVPMKVHFDGSDSTAQSSSSSSWYDGMTRSRRLINPIAIACGKYHNAAITSDGQVYTWGTSSESLGRNPGHNASTSHRITTSPQLVTAMLPENGGGFAVALSASDQHTAVVTSTGALFTWGVVAGGENAMGHEGVRWQPCPKRVPGVHRAVSVAVAKEHTVVLVATVFPPVPLVSGLQSLELLSAHKVLMYVDLFNVLPILIMAEYAGCDFLVNYCTWFVRENLDGVLNVAKKSVLKQYLDDMVLQSFHQPELEYRDDRHHPLIADIIAAGSTGRPTFDRDWLSSAEEWAEACETMSSSPAVQRLLAGVAVKEYEEELQRLHHRGRRRRASSVGTEHDSQIGKMQIASSKGEGSEPEQHVKEGSIDRIIHKTANLDISTRESAEEQSRWLAKEIRSVQKKLTQIAKLRESEAKALILTMDEQAKVDRKPVLEAELYVYQTALDEVEKKVQELALAKKSPTTKSDNNGESHNVEAAPPTKGDEPVENQHKGERETAEPDGNALKRVNTTTFTCFVCGVKCPDSMSYELHNSGRKHRNRLAQVAEAEQREFAQSIMTQKHLDQVKLDVVASQDTVYAKSPATKNAWGISTATPPPKFKLPPPPHPVVPQVVVAAKPTHAGPLGAGLPPSKAWKVSPPRQASVPTLTHFQSILNEQQEAAKLKAQHQRPRTNLPITASSASLAWTPPVTSTTPFAKKVSPAIPNSDKFVSRTGNTSSNADSKRTGYSLADFLTPKPTERPPSTASPGTASWASPPKTALSTAGSVPSPSTSTCTPQKKSLTEIQAEETEYKAREDRACSQGGDQAWYLGRRERADSLHAIQEAAERERELQILIQEQMEIEAQIQRDRCLAAGAATRDKKNKRKTHQSGQNGPATTSSGNKGNNRKGKKNTTSATQQPNRVTVKAAESLSR